MPILLSRVSQDRVSHDIKLLSTDTPNHSNETLFGPNACAAQVRAFLGCSWPGCARFLAGVPREAGMTGFPN